MKVKNLCLTFSYFMVLTEQRNKNLKKKLVAETDLTA